MNRIETLAADLVQAIRDGKDADDIRMYTNRLALALGLDVHEDDEPHVQD